MSSKTVLILGHSFVRRFKEYLLETEDQREHEHFDIAQEPVNIVFHGVGGRTVEKIETFDTPAVQKLRPNTIILEVGTNDLTNLKPDVLATQIVSLVQLMHFQQNVKTILVCQIIQRTRQPRATFNDDVQRCNTMLAQKLKQLPFAYFWRHKGLNNPGINVLKKDGVHLNQKGNYILYRSYRGAILNSLK